MELEQLLSELDGFDAFVMDQNMELEYENTELRTEVQQLQQRVENLQKQVNEWRNLATQLKQRVGNMEAAILWCGEKCLDEIKPEVIDLTD